MCPSCGGELFIVQWCAHCDQGVCFGCWFLHHEKMNRC